MTQLYFAAALRVGADASCTRLLPLNLLREPLAPHERLSQRILLGLQALGFIEPELHASHAKDWPFSRGWTDHGFTSVSWRILKKPSVADASAMDASHWLTDPEFDADALKTLATIWEDLALAEVAEYARWSLSRSAFNPEWADEAVPAFQHGLKHFGINRMMYLVHIALRSVTMVHQRGSARTAQLGHIFASSISHYVHRAVLEKWSVRGMTRSTDLPRSSITILFADVVTGLGERYFTEQPSLEALVRSMTSQQTLH